MKPKLDPAYRSIEKHIRHAQLERSLYLAELIASGIVAVSRGVSVATARLAKAWKSPAPVRRPTAKHGYVGDIGRVDVKAFEQLVQPDALDFIADRDAEGAIFIMDANGDHGMIEAHVFHARQSEQELTGIGAKLIHEMNIRCPAALPMAGCRLPGAMRHVRAP